MRWIAKATAVTGTALLMTAGGVNAVETKNRAISESEVLQSQKAWGEALVAISREYEEKGVKPAQEMAAKVIDAAYGYQFGPVLFKPTLTQEPQTFRTDREGALSYFVGQNPKYPSDTGFALKGWREVEVKNAAILLDGEYATTLGNVSFTDKDGKVTTVDKSWTFKKDDEGTIRIVQHHSSLPYSAK
ncbi:hypothetical protein GGQ73_001269 [Rhizobium skierniewicense]|uniref:Phosphoribosyl-AMP cyclohydrolase n=1 Tax=Rhizobium skierniewicense TaxID=984260 RepID=A0A7W6G2A5_9HYPH|nr:hypothetical protein [Rhizobium skierniewicense]MBB3945336.1 hypothetical protein [Rhizobium skierniewicense]NTF34244.1 hypothetical protein [Rhizobium skierniewicense]